MSTAASKQKSRKGKKAWRKNVDINDIEVNLDELRAEERTTGGKVHQRPDELLFTLDTKGDSKTIKTLRKDRPLKMDEILAERSKVPALAGRKKPASTAPAINPVKSNAKISKAERERLLSLIRRKTSNSLFATTPKNLGRRGMTDAVKAAGTYDVWGEEPAKEEEMEEESEEEAETDFVKEVITKAPVKAPATLKMKPKVAIPAVKESHPGASYNPTMQDHQDLLRIAHEEELKLLQEKEKLEAQLAYPKELDEMVPFDDRTGGLLEDTDEEEDEEEEEDESGGEDEETGTKKKVKGKKTKAERNRLARAQERLKKEQEMKKNKELLKQANQVKEIMKTVEQEEAEAEKRRIENEAKKEEKARAGMKRVGKFNIPKEKTQVQLQEELAESLRQLKPEGNLLKDRFQSFVERNIIEPRMPVAKRRRYKLKTYEKHSYKRFDNPNHA